MLKPITALFIIAATISLSYQQVSAPLSMVQNNKYFVSGRYAPGRMRSNESEQFQIPFSFAIQSSEVAGIYLNLYSISTYSSSESSSIVFYSTVLLFSRTSFKTISNNTFFGFGYVNISYRFLAFSTRFADNYNWKLITINQSINILNSTVCQYNSYMIPVSGNFNTTSNIDYALSITGLYYYLYNSIFQLEVKLIDLTLHLPSKICLLTYFCGLKFMQNLPHEWSLYSLYANVIIFNRDHFQTAGFAWFYQTYITKLPFYNYTNLYEHALLMGLDSMKNGTYQCCGFHFQFLQNNSINFYYRQHKARVSARGSKYEFFIKTESCLLGMTDICIDLIEILMRNIVVVVFGLHVGCIFL